MATLRGIQREFEACIALGSNLGDRRANIRDAIERIGHAPSTRVLAVSAMHATEPVATAPGVNPGGEFINAAARLATALTPRELLDALKAIERSMGRDPVTQAHGGPRVIDLDISLYSDRIVLEPGLHVPHERLCERLFVLKPLAEVAGEWPVPTAGLSVRRILEIVAAGGAVPTGGHREQGATR